jgi:hypothetical protein
MVLLTKSNTILEQPGRLRERQHVRGSVRFHHRCATRRRRQQAELEAVEGTGPFGARRTADGRVYRLPGGLGSATGAIRTVDRDCPGPGSGIAAQGTEAQGNQESPLTIGHEVRLVSVSGAPGRQFLRGPSRQREGLDGARTGFAAACSEPALAAR